MEIKKMFIGGEWVESVSGNTFDAVNPATGEGIATITEATVEDARLAVAAAKKSFYETREWRDMDSQTRGDVLLQIADMMTRRGMSSPTWIVLTWASRFGRRRRTWTMPFTTSAITPA